ncbi:C5-sterol desaturase [Gloeophyllum trabeum ATCC 11539]|uniref:C5-sterol desaturase n=1 Tax=Gloeophyllum trabeum (strain ATCC 11539 / FP-39264 / Madison 617) TaxID=670483 RepID=S7PYH8_GLOTA|nr:C5-sterol desaturase [Gloeophyllum trabeum ATCC 11539]EPQ52706.1 C5-sterol desaturase [Gloeophyllum trabeum ATCC 11539]
MDFVLRLADDYVLDKVWAAVLPSSTFSADSQAVVNATSYLPVAGSSSSWSHMVSFIPQSLAISQTESAWPRDYIPRQLISLLVITLIGIHLLYFIIAGLSYQFIFNHEMMKHPRFLKNQVRQEIMSSLRAFPGMTLLTIPWFQAEVMGYSLLYDDVRDYGWTYFFASIALFLLFTDYGIYWVHRLLHHPLVYKHVHKPHHKWIIPTPFASHAFHFLDGYLQSVPYHLFIFIFPLHRLLYLGLFVVVNIWSILIHDSDMITGHPLETIINGPAHHTLHHLYFTVNYGQYFTWADRWGGSYRQPESSLDPLLEIKEHHEKKAE